MKKPQVTALPLPIEDAEYILERVAQTLRAHDVPTKKALRALAEAATRLLRIAACDHDLIVSRKVVNIEARRIALRLLTA
jgi:hypothetical protein